MNEHFLKTAGRFIRIVLACQIFSLHAMAQKVHVNENFNASVLPPNWSTNAISGSSAFVFGLDGAASNAFNQNINGTAMAIFDDDALGGSAQNNTASLITPSFNNSLDSSTILEFSYNFRDLANNFLDFFRVEVFDGSSWNQVLNVQTDDCGSYIQTNCTSNGFPFASIDISAYKNANCQVRFIYDDGDDFSWYVGIDDVYIYSDPLYDLKLNDIINLKSLSLCNEDTSKLYLEIENIGLRSLDSVIVHYQVNNLGYFLDTIYNSIPANSTYYYVTNNELPFNLGSNSVDVFLEQQLDSIKFNDSLLNFLYSHSVLPSVFPFTRPFPFVEDFDGFTPGTGFFNDGDVIRNRWRRSSATSVDYSWRTTDIPSPSLNTGPLSDVTGGNYMYTEASRGVVDDIATLTSTCLQNPADSLVGLVFYSHRYGIGDSKMIIKLVNGPREYILDTLSALQNSSSEDWSRHRYVLQNSPLNRSYVEFTGIKGISVRGDFAIDDLKFYPFSEEDAEVRTLTSPQSECFLTNSEQIVIEIENVGTKTIAANTLTANYKVDNGLGVNQLVPVAIPADSTISFTFNQRANFSIANRSYQVMTSVNSSADINYTNDTSYFEVNNITQSLTYVNDFENIILNGCQADGPMIFTVTDSTLPFNWFDSSGTWAIQNTSLCNNFTAVQGATSSDSTGPATAFSGTNFLYQEASGNVAIPRILRTNCFDFNNQSQVSLEFRYHMYGRRMGDLYIEIERSNGNIVVVDSIKGQMQTSSTAPWILKTVSLNAFVGQIVRLRFRAEVPTTGTATFMSDMAIDSLVIFNPQTVALEEFDNKESLSVYPNPNDGEFNLRLSQEMIGKRYTIVNTKGQLVREEVVKSANQRINLDKQPNGIYFLRLEGYSLPAKFIVF